MVTSAQVVETSVNVTSNSPSQDYTHPDNHNLPNYLFLSSWQAAYQHENAGVFLAKCVRNAVKTMVVDRKNQKALALLYLASKPLRKAANSSGVPTEFEQNRRQI